MRGVEQGRGKPESAACQAALAHIALDEAATAGRGAEEALLLEEAEGRARGALGLRTALLGASHLATVEAAALLARVRLRKGEAQGAPRV